VEFLNCEANTLTIARPDARTIQIAAEVMGVFMTLKQQRGGQAAHRLLGDAGCR
jgi:hypothetical protein